MALHLHIDGTSQGNPGPTGVGIVIQDQDERVVHQTGRFLGELTDMEGAIQGLLIGLEAAVAVDASEIAVFSSSQWLVRQLTGQGRDPGDPLAMLLAQAQMLLLQFDGWQITHVPTEENKLAVALSQHAARAGHDVEAPTRQDPAPAHRSDEDVPVVVRVTEGANTRTCPEPCGAGEVFEFGEVAPAHMCLDALGAVLDVVMACKRDDDQVIAALPVTRRCARPGCGAVFQIDLRLGH